MKDLSKCPTCGQKLPVVSIPSCWIESEDIFSKAVTTTTYTSEDAPRWLK